MSELPPRFVLLNGFDRSGTSMVAKVLAQHPDIECLFQPFSSTVVHDTEWKYWAPDEEYPAVQSFLDGLKEGMIDRSFIESDWFENHSTTFEIEPDLTYVIKSTKLHFKVDWFAAHYPSIPVYAIERKPHGILASLFRNGFYEDWYGEEAYKELCQYASTDEALSQSLRKQVNQADTNLERMAVMVAVRTTVMRRSVPPKRTLTYENVLDDAEAELIKLTKPMGLSDYPFSEHLDRDYNITGKQHRRHDLWKSYFDDEEKRTIEKIFSTV